MAAMKILPPWISSSKKPSEEDEVIWMDVDGSYHLGKRKGDKVVPVTYGGAPDVEIHYENFPCYKYITAPQVA
jgi:hypothetical protein